MWENVTRCYIVQPYGLKLWVSEDLAKQFRMVGKDLNRAIWGKRSKEERLLLYQKAIVNFNVCIQRLRTNNCEYANLKPLEKLLEELSGFLTVEGLQLQLNLELF